MSRDDLILLYKKGVGYVHSFLSARVIGKDKVGEWQYSLFVKATVVLKKIEGVILAKRTPFLNHLFKELLAHARDCSFILQIFWKSVLSVQPQPCPCVLLGFCATVDAAIPMDNSLSANYLLSVIAVRDDECILLLQAVVLKQLRAKQGRLLRSLTALSRWRAESRDRLSGLLIDRPVYVEG